MAQLIALAFLIGNEHSLSALVAEQHSPILQKLEASAIELPAIDKREDQAVREKGAEFLQEVERRLRAAWALAMKKANGRVEPYSFEHRTDVVKQKYVDEGKNCIDSVQRRTPRAAPEIEQLLVASDERIEGGEIGARGIALNSAQAVRVRLPRSLISLSMSTVPQP